MFASFTLPPVLAKVPELVNVQHHTKLVKTLGLESPRRRPSISERTPEPPSLKPSPAPLQRRSAPVPHRPSHRRAKYPVYSPELLSKPLPPPPSKILQTPILGKLLMAKQRMLQRRNTLPSPTTPTTLFGYPPRRRASERTKNATSTF